MDSTTAGSALRKVRTTLGMSQSRVARESGVPRWKINAFELGDDTLKGEDLTRVQAALQAESKRLRNLPDLPSIASGGQAA